MRSWMARCSERVMLASARDEAMSARLSLRVAPAQVGVVRIWQVGGSVRSPMGRLADWVTLAVGPDGTCDRARDCEEELRSRCASLCRPHRRLPKEVRMMKKALIIVRALPTHATV